MTKKLAQVLKFSAVAVGASLILSSCAAIVPMADPLGKCGTETNISMSVTNNKPDVDFVFKHINDDDDTNTDSSNDDADPTQTDELVPLLAGEDITLALSGDQSILEVEYRAGIFDEKGLPGVDDSFLPEPYALRGDDAPPAFLDTLDDFEGEGSPTIELVPLDFSGGRSLTAPFSEFLFGPEADLYELSDGEVILYMFQPGAFLVRCNSGEGQLNDGELVAAVQMFPNLITFEGSPTFQLTPDIEDPTLYNTELFLGPELAGDLVIVLGKPTTGAVELSADPAKDRWLQIYSRENVSPVFSLTDGPPAEVDEYGFVNLNGESINFQPDTTYNLILFIIEGDAFGDGPSLSTYQSPFRTGIFDLAINSDGVGEAAPFIVEEPRRPGRSNAPILTDIRDSISISTKGNRELKITGNRLNKVLQAKLGDKAAKIVSAEDAILTLRLPSLATGIYDLTLTYQSGEIVRPKFLKYIKSTKIDQITIPKSQKKAAWSLLMASLLSANPEVIQVDCVARVPVGTKAAPVKKKASAICAQVTDDSIKTRMVVKKAPAGPTPSVAIKLWD